MQRRELIALLGGAAASSLVSSIAAAQSRSGKIARVGIIDDSAVWNPFRDAMRDGGYVEGQTVAYEYSAGNGNPERLDDAAAELVRKQVNVIAAFGTPAGRAAQAATSTIPIVVISVGDPIAAGLVQSLARPGGNITGNTILAPDLAPKRLQLLKEMLPSTSRVALFWNPDNASSVAVLDQLRIAAPKFGFSVVSVEARNAQELEAAFAALTRERPDAVLLTNDPVHQANIHTIIAFMIHHKLPGMFQNRDNVAAGGLMSYGASLPDLFRAGATYVQKILKGTNPNELPVQTPEKFQLVINLQTAKTMGLRISESVVLRADEVIE